MTVLLEPIKDVWSCLILMHECRFHGSITVAVNACLQIVSSHGGSVHRADRSAPDLTILRTLVEPGELVQVQLLDPPRRHLADPLDRIVGCDLLQLFPGIRCDIPAQCQDSDFADLG
jgi:hypothetical protein